MAKKTSTKTPSQTRTAAASKHGKPGKPGNKASVGAAFAKRTASSITGDIRSLAAEVKDLRSLRAKYDQLLAEHHGLVGALRELSTELAGSARSAWKQYRTGGKSGKGSMTGMTSSSTLMGRPRVRAASAEVDAMTAKLLASLPTAWSTKQEVCRAAGLDPTEANSAFRRLVLGYTRGGKKVHPAIETNGKRGIEGRYRKA